MRKGAILVQIAPLQISQPNNQNQSICMWLTWTVYATLLMTLSTDLGLSIRVSMFEHVDW